MNFSILSSNEKLAVYGSIAVIIGILIASGGFLGFGLGFLALIAAIAMLVIVFLPQMSGGTSLPGSKGTLMFAAGIIAAAVLVITLIQFLGFIGSFLGSLNGIFFLIAVVGSLVMAWAGWGELQTEGGTFRFGSGGTSGTTGTTRTGPAPGSPPANTSGRDSTSVGSSAPPPPPPPSSTGSTDMGSEGGPAARRDDDEDSLRNP
jgi:hypothetical protein